MIICAKARDRQLYLKRHLSIQVPFNKVSYGYAYLENHNLSKVSPYYWSFLTLLRENDLLLPNKKSWLLYLMIDLVICYIQFVI